MRDKISLTVAVKLAEHYGRPVFNACFSDGLNFVIVLIHYLLSFQPCHFFEILRFVFTFIRFRTIVSLFFVIGAILRYLRFDTIFPFSRAIASLSIWVVRNFICNCLKCKWLISIIHFCRTIGECERLWNAFLLNYVVFFDDEVINVFCLQVGHILILKDQFPHLINFHLVNWAALALWLTLQATVRHETLWLTLKAFFIDGLWLLLHWAICIDVVHVHAVELQELAVKACLAFVLILKLLNHVV